MSFEIKDFMNHKLNFYSWFNPEETRKMLQNMKLNQEKYFCAKTITGETIYLEKLRICYSCQKNQSYFDPYWTTAVKMWDDCPGQILVNVCLECGEERHKKNPVVPYLDLSRPVIT